MASNVRDLAGSNQNSASDLTRLTAPQLAERLRLVKEAIRKAEGSGSENRFHATTYKPKTVTRSVGAYGISEQVQEVLDAEEKLRDLLHLSEPGEGSDRGHIRHGCPEHDPCGEKKKPMDMEQLAEMVFDRLMVELRVERERTGLTV